MERKRYVSKYFTEKHIKNIFDINNVQPILIELSGTPNSGKTSALKLLETILRRYNIDNVKIIYESAKNCCVKNKYSPLFNHWTSSETIKSIIEAMENNFNIIICERGLFDSLCWMKSYRNDNILNNNQFTILKNFYLNFDWSNILKYILIVKCSIQRAIARDESSHLISRHGTIVNPIVLQKYNSAIGDVIKALTNQPYCYSIIDSTNLTVDKTNMEIISSIFDFISSLHNNSSIYF